MPDTDENNSTPEPAKDPGPLYDISTRESPRPEKRDT